MNKQNNDYNRCKDIYLNEIDKMTDTLKEYLHLLGKTDYSPYKEKQTKTAIRALLNIRGLKK